MKLIKRKKIFMTGGAGFIGSSLAKKLIQSNKITIYDTFTRDAIKNTSLAKHPNIKLIKGDVLNSESLKRAAKGNDIIIHLAAVAGIDTVIKSPTRTMEVNMLGTHNALKAAKAAGKIERFIDFSTSEVYGSYAYKLEERDDTKMGAVGEARWTYAVSKLAGEHLAHSYYKEFGLPAVSVRPFNIYGPGQIGEGAIHAFVTRAISNENINVVGNGGQIRSWCYIDDIIDALLLVITKKEAVGEVFNIGNPRGTVNILNLAKKIIKLSGSASKIIFKPKLYVDVALRIPDIKKAKKMLGFKPEISLNEGLKKTIDWYREKKRCA